MDVRDVALAALRAAVRPAAGGTRFILSASTYPVRTLVADLRTALGPSGVRLPSYNLPSWVLRLASVFDGSLQLILPMLGVSFRVDHSAAEVVLGIHWRDVRTAGADMALGLLARGTVQDGSGGKAVAASPVPLAHWLSYAPAPPGASPEAAARYLFTSDELRDVAAGVVGRPAVAGATS